MALGSVWVVEDSVAAHVHALELEHVFCLGWGRGRYLTLRTYMYHFSFRFGYFHISIFPQTL